MSRILRFGTEESPVYVDVPDNSAEHYVDGVAGLAVGFPVSKLILTNKDPYNEDENEVRKAVCTLTVPTEALLDIAKLVVDGIGFNHEFLKHSSKEHASALREKLAYASEQKED